MKSPIIETIKPILILVSLIIQIPYFCIKLNKVIE